MITVRQANLLANVIWDFFIRAFYVIGCVVCKKKKRDESLYKAPLSRSIPKPKLVKDIREKQSPIEASIEVVLHILLIW